MPISVKKDIKKAFGFGNHFFLGDTPTLNPNSGHEDFTFKIRDIKGTYLKNVKSVIADQNWEEFYSSWGIINPTRDLAKATARKFNLLESEEDIFDELWILAKVSRDYKKEEKTNIENDIKKAYELTAKIAAESEDADYFKHNPTLARQISRNDSLFVIFSDFHMTAYKNKPNYFDEFNYTLYTNVLKSYYAKYDYCLVENGDVEECIISEFTLKEASERTESAPKSLTIEPFHPMQIPITNKHDFPITANDNDGKWDVFLSARYKIREANLEAIITKYKDYYALIREKFISKGKYVRIAGNHDTYLDDGQGGDETGLKIKIEEELQRHMLPKFYVTVQDILKIKRSGEVKYVVMHGHQFDTEGIQIGDIPYAKSIGEMGSECLAWCNEGADRIWQMDDTKKWYIGNSQDPAVTTKGNFRNVLAREEPSDYKHDAGTESGSLLGGGSFDLLVANTNQIKDDPKGWAENVLGHEIAWEYFENSENAFNAYTLEYWTGDEGFKMRHLNEIELCEKYRHEYLKLKKDELGEDYNPNVLPVPKLILGHTHEPRQNSVKYLPIDLVYPFNLPATTDDLISDPYYWYLNTGSAGRYENLIWCVEILENIDKICSWSEVDGKLKKIVWKSVGDKLIHDPDIPPQIFDIISA